MRLFYKAHYILFLAFIVISSCSKDSTHEVKFDGDHYVKVDDIRTFEQQDILHWYDSISKIQEYRLVGLIANHVNSGVVMKRIRYQTKAKDGTNFVASGLLSYPSGNGGSYPILCFHNGTNVLHSKAPSENYQNDFFKLLESLASLGFVVVMPDYPGFGVSDYRTHPYLIKDETIPSSKDILLATKEYFEEVDLGVDLNDELFLMGYSQGAWATLQLQRSIELEGLSDFNLVASSCGSGPYSISKLFGELFANPDLTEISNPYFFAYLMNAYKEYDLLDTLELFDVFNEPYASKIPALFNGQNKPQSINDSLTTDVSLLLNSAYLSALQNLDNPNYAPILTAFLNNDVEGWRIETPTKLYHGTADNTVPFEITEDMVSKLKNFPPDNQIGLTGSGHTDAVVPFGMLTLQWFIQLNNQ